VSKNCLQCCGENRGCFSPRRQERQDCKYSDLRKAVGSLGVLARIYRSFHPLILQTCCRVKLHSQDQALCCGENRGCLSPRRQERQDCKYSDLRKAVGSLGVLGVLARIYRSFHPRILQTCCQVKLHSQDQALWAPAVHAAPADTGRPPA
jgi:hypothetical protein